MVSRSLNQMPYLDDDQYREDKLHNSNNGRPAFVILRASLIEEWKLVSDINTNGRYGIIDR